MPDHVKEYSFDAIELTLRASESCFDEFELRKTLMKVLTFLNVYNCADILIEGVLRATECRLAQMNVFSHYCSTSNANDCVFFLNGIRKVYCLLYLDNHMHQLSLVGLFFCSGLGYMVLRVRCLSRLCAVCYGRT